jgi:hypothetical protein
VLASNFGQALPATGPGAGTVGAGAENAGTCTTGKITPGLVLM